VQRLVESKQELLTTAVSCDNCNMCSEEYGRVAALNR
jgi:hypothetical protein